MGKDRTLEIIKTEIESLKSIEYPCDNSQQATGFFNALDRMTDFLFTLESEKPMCLEGLKEEYKDYVESDPVYSKLVNRNAGLSIARHFAEWGAEHFRDTTKMISGSSEIQKDLEEAAREFAKDAYPDKHNLVWMFKRGAKWDRSQMMKEAVEVQVVGEQRDLRLIDSTQRCLFNAKRGDWLKIIIVKEDEK